MTVLLYAITDAQPRPAEGDGLNQRPLRTLTHENLSAVVSDADAEPSTDERQLWAYEQIVERLMADSTLLPARFGTSAETDEEIRAMLGDRKLELTEALARVREAVEYAVRPPAPAQAETTDEPAQSGTAYIERLLARDRPIRELDRAAEQLFRAKQRTTYGTAYLVDRSRSEEFLRTASRQGLIVTGPWPPYSFTTPA